jgi:hypothetical protein
MANTTGPARHFLVRIGDGKNFKKSSPKFIWGMSIIPKQLKKDDILWFVQRGGNIIGVATYDTHIDLTKTNGDLVNLEPTDQEIGWEIGSRGTTKSHIYYRDLYNIEKLGNKVTAKGQSPYQKYCQEKHGNDLETEYRNIVKYSTVTKGFNTMY